jgi:hypothetical protein
LSIRQPWAYLVITAQKSVELRSWGTNYRGPLVIHAAQRIEETAVEYFGLGAVRWPVGVALGVVQLVDVVTWSRHDLMQQHWSHRAWGPFRHGMRGFVFGEQRVLSRPVPMSGAKGLFPLAPGQLDEIRSRLEARSASSTDSTFVR